MKNVLALVVVGFFATSGFAADPKAGATAPAAKSDVAAPAKKEVTKEAVAPKKPAAALAPAATAAKPSEPTVELKTSAGDIVIKLFPQKAPVSVKNFLSYVDKKFYDNTVFHRVMENFMIQGGGFNKDGATLTQKATDAGIINEARNGLKNNVYTVSMARKGLRDWSDATSTTSQFFINVKDNGSLDYPSGDGFGYAVFGEVVKGKDVVEKIKSSKTAKRSVKVMDEGKLFDAEFDDVPVKDVVIISARRL